MDPKDTRPPDAPGRELGSPYGPQPNGGDTAEGGADSSPYDNEATGERMDHAAEDKRQNPKPGDRLNPGK